MELVIGTDDYSTIENMLTTALFNSSLKDKMIKALHGECDNLKTSKEETKKLLEEARLKIQTLEAELTAKQHDVEMKTGEIDQLKSEVLAGQQLVIERDKQIMQIKRHNADEQAKLKNKLDEYVKENNNLQTSLKTANCQKEDLEMDLVTLCEQNVEYNSRLSESSRQIEEQKQVNSRLQKILDFVQKANADLDNKLEAAKTAKMKQTARLQFTENEMHKLKDELNKSKQFLLQFAEKLDPTYKQIFVTNTSSHQEGSYLQCLQRFAQLFVKTMGYYGAGCLAMSRSVGSLFPVENASSDTIFMPPCLTPYSNSSLTDCGNQQLMITNGPECQNRYQFPYEHEQPSSSTQEQQSSNIDDHDEIRMSDTESSDTDCDSNVVTVPVVNSRISITNSFTSPQKINLSGVPLHWKTVNVPRTSLAIPGTSSGSRVDTTLEEDAPTEYQCPYKVRKKQCPEKFLTVDALNLHCFDDHKKMSSAVRCSACGKLFSTANEFNEHVDTCIRSSSCCS